MMLTMSYADLIILLLNKEMEIKADVIGTSRS